MRFFTSFGPRHVDTAVKTWKRYADQICAIQAEGEQAPEGVEIIVNKPCLIWNKKLQRISDMIKIGRQFDDTICLINSDIELDENDELWASMLEKSKEGLVFVQRHTYTERKSETFFEKHAIDMFLINSKLEIPNEQFVVGGCAWDWWIPNLAVRQGIPLFRVSRPFAYHKKHKRNWNASQFEQAQVWFEKALGFRNNGQKKEEITRKAQEL